MNPAVAKPSLIRDILQFHLRGRRGLDYAAYAKTQGAEIKEPLIDVIRPPTSGWWEGFGWWKKRDIAQPQVAELLERFGLTKRSVEVQVTLWRQLIPVIHQTLCKLDEEFVRVGQGENVRVVFDIDMGGIFYTRVGGHGFLFGVTLDQGEVNNRRCEEEMRRMVAEIEAVCTAHGA